MRDILEAMLAAQADVQKTLGNDLVVMPSRERMVYITTMVTACTDELHEALNETGWKPWATSDHINAEEFKGEMTDAWLFFMNLMLAGGMTAEDLIERTAKKQDNALLRHANGYDGRTSKCPRCRRAYDNAGVKCTPEKCGYQSPDVECSMCSALLTAPGVMCRPANHYQGNVPFCATTNTYGEAVVFPTPEEDHCLACLSPIGSTSCNNPGKFSIGWCARYKCGHSPSHGLMHGSHGRDKASA